MDVPEMMLKVGPGCPARTADAGGGGPTWSWGGHAASTFTPGPVMSGFRIPGFWRLGPREEKKAMDGAGDVPRIVPPKRIFAVGLAADWT